MESDEYSYDEDGTKYYAIKDYFDSLNKEDIMFKDKFTMFETCKIIVTLRFITEDEHRGMYWEDVKNLYALMWGIQPWKVHVERNDVPLDIVSED